MLHYIKARTKNEVAKALKRIKKGMEKLLKEEPNDYLTEAELKEKIKRLKKQEEDLLNLKNILDELAAETEDDSFRINMTDPDSLVMCHKDGTKKPSYNHQSAVDGKYGVTTAIQTSTECDKANDLFELEKKSAENTGKSHKHIIADSGFCDYNALETMAEKEEALNQEKYFVPDKQMEADKTQTFFRGKLRQCKFVQDATGSYICPAGEKMEFLREYKQDGKLSNKYIGTKCESCILKKQCTAASKRTITINVKESFRVKMRAKLDSPKGRKIYEKRQWIVEAPHGHDQKNSKWRQHHLRRLEKAHLEFSLLRIASNLGKIIKFTSQEVIAMA